MSASEASVSWADVRVDMAWHGALRDIYVFGTDARSWADLLEAFRNWGYTDPTKW